ncbi:pentatricopeptide repeat-containing protein At2g01510, mitochondrial-like [Primulina tabacum]|uniref:pentatricopeptide repeat-containing protein At2g01510, mitochondrial-like n=1 Tax=Primulina tabacum TaxID=48773 RepID=UPI003F59C655
MLPEGQDLRDLNALLIVNGLIQHQSLIKRLIAKCCLPGFPELALSAFKTTKKPSLSLQNLFLKSLCDNGMFGNVSSVYERSRNSGRFSDNYTYPFVIKACYELISDVGCGESIHCLVIMVLKRVVSWNIMISGCVDNGEPERALLLLHQMRELQGAEFDLVTLISIPSYCNEFQNIILGSAIHNYAIRTGFADDISLANSLGEKRSISKWNTILSLYLLSKSSGGAFVFFLDLLQNNIEARDIVKILLRNPPESFLKSLSGACLSHENYELGEEIGRLLLETNWKDSGLCVILHNIYAAAGKHGRTCVSSSH